MRPPQSARRVDSAATGAETGLRVAYPSRRSRVARFRAAQGPDRARCSRSFQRPLHDRALLVRVRSVYAVCFAMPSVVRKSNSDLIQAPITRMVDRLPGPKGG